MIRKILLTILAIFAIWIAGFFYYLYIINSYKVNNNTTNAIAVIAGGGHKIETGIVLLKAGYAPVLFITGIETPEQLRNLLKEHNVIEQQVILAPNKIMSEEDYIKKISKFVSTYNLTSIRLVAYNHNMPFLINEIAKAISSARPVYIVPHPISSKQKYEILFRAYNHYLMSLFNIKL